MDFCWQNVVLGVESKKGSCFKRRDCVACMCGICVSFPTTVTFKLIIDSSQVSREIEVLKMQSSGRFCESLNLDGAGTVRERLRCEPLLNSWKPASGVQMGLP